MSSSTNKPTGQGYVSPMQRECTVCGHRELLHYGRCLYHPACDCRGFSGRDLDPAELAIMWEQEEQIERELKYVGEAWLDEFVEDFKRKQND